METNQIEMPRGQALAAYKQYLSHREHQTEVDEEVRRIYYAISKGKMVIKAMQSIIDAGLGEDGKPKLAIAPADSKFCHLRYLNDGSAIFAGTENAAWTLRASATRTITLPRGSLPVRGRNEINIQAKARMPLIPPQHRPKRGLAGYHVLWEAEWTPTPPRDPMLLKRIGKSDAFVVLAVWDLTEAERAVLATRMRA